MFRQVMSTIIRRRCVLLHVRNGGKRLSQSYSLLRNSAAATHQVNGFRRISSIADFNGLQKKTIPSFLLGSATGRRFYHGSFGRLPLPKNNSTRPLQQATGQDLLRNLYCKEERSRRAKPYWILFKRHKFVGRCIVFTIFFCTLNWVPYTNRIHMVFRTDVFENIIGWCLWKDLKLKKRHKLISPRSPESSRALTVLGDIVQAMNTDLGLQHDCEVSVVVLKSEKEKILLKNSDALLISRSGSSERGLLEIVNPVLKIPGKGRKLGLKYGTKHLKRNWEVMVVDSPIENALYLPNGKIVLYTGLIRSCNDVELAAVLGHEVGHGVGRHQGELLIKILLSSAIYLLDVISLPVETKNQLDKLVFNFFSRRRELEADYIGLMLMAAAGYDPREAPQFFKKLNSDEKDSIHSTHPCGARREKMLNQDQVMKQAVEIYEQVKAKKSMFSGFER